MLNEEFAFSETTYSTIEKVIAVAAFILLLPLTAPLAIIGTVALMCSTSQQDIMDRYSDHQAKLLKLLTNEELEPEEFVEELLEKLPNSASEKELIDQNGIFTLDQCKSDIEIVKEQKNPDNTEQLVESKINLQHCDVQNQKNEIIALVTNKELSSKLFLSQLSEKIPRNVRDEEPINKDELKTLDEFKAQLLEIINEEQNKIDTDKLVRAKTRYLQGRDIQKFEIHQGIGIPNPNPNCTLLSRNEFDLRFQIPESDCQEVIEVEDFQDGSEEMPMPILEFPEYMYRYDHPADSQEGSPMAQLGFRPAQTTSNWKNALDYTQASVLANPIKNLNVEELYALIFTLHDKIVEDKEEIRDQFILVSDPNKCEVSFPDMEAYLRTEENGPKLAKKISRLQQKIHRWGTFEKTAPYISPKEWDALQKAVFIPPSPDGLEQKAKAFLKDALQLMEEGTHHPYQVAAFLHYGLTTLHLFEDGNGRLSRLITNIYLMQEGYKPFYVVSDSYYTNLFKHEDYDVAFAEFLSWSNKKIEERKNRPAQQDGCAMM